MGLVRVILLLGHLAVVVLLGASFLNAWLPPKFLGYLNLLSLAFPFLVILHGIFTLCWLLMWKKRGIVFLVFSLLLLNPVRRWVNYNAESPRKANLKVVTFNSHSGDYAKTLKGKESVEQFIREQQADFILFQEQRKRELQNPNYHSQDIIGIYTPHKILKTESLISEDYNAYSFYADVEVDGRIVRVINVYLQPFELEKSMVKPTQNMEVNKEKGKKLLFRLIPTFKDHQVQVQMVRKAVEASPYPVILAGDFNAVPNSWEYYHLGKDLVDAFMEVGKGSATSFHSFKFPIRIDYIFTSPSIKPVSYRVDRGVTLSDHFPVIATFEW